MTTEQIRERFEAQQKRLQENPRDHSARESMMLLSEAYQYRAKQEKLRARIEGNIRPADLLTDSQRSAIDAMNGETAGTIAKRLGLCKEYVADYLRTIQ